MVEVFEQIQHNAPEISKNSYVQVVGDKEAPDNLRALKLLEDGRIVVGQIRQGGIVMVYDEELGKLRKIPKSQRDEYGIESRHLKSVMDS